MAAIGAAIVAALVIYFPHGQWKLVLLLAVAVGIIVALRNPKFLLMRMGAVCVTAGVVGLTASFAVRADVQAPDGSKGSVDIAIELLVSEWALIIVIVVGGAMIVADRIWPYGGRVSGGGETKDSRTLALVASQEIFPLSPVVNETHRERFAIVLPATNKTDHALRILRAEIAGAEKLRLGVDNNDRVFGGDTVPAGETRDLQVVGETASSANDGGLVRRELFLIDSDGARHGPIELTFER